MHKNTVGGYTNKIHAMKFSSGVLSIIFGLLSVPAYASENGLSHFPVGVNTMASGLLPSEGNGEIAMYSVYSNDTYFAGKNGKGTVPGFDSSVVSFVPRFLYTLPKNVDPLSLPVTLGVIVPMLNLNLNIGPMHGHTLGIGDIAIETDLHLDSPRHGFFSYAGLATYFPTGSYNKDRLANLGQNYFTFHPEYALSWFPNRNIEIDNTISASFNTTNTATKYHSGASLYDEYSANYRLLPNSYPSFFVGIIGFAQKQFQDDTIDGARYADGFRGQSFGIGPQFTYYLFHNKGGFIVKYVHQYGVRNQAKGDEIWAELAIPIE